MASGGSVSRDGEPIRTRVDAWANPQVLRVYRADADTYRAVVADSDTRGAEAVILTMTAEGDTGGWTIDSVERADASHGWPTN